MSLELEAIFGSQLVTTVFLYGSAAMLVVSMLAVTWLTRKPTPERQPKLVRSYPQPTAQAR